MRAQWLRARWLGVLTASAALVLSACGGAIEAPAGLSADEGDHLTVCSDVPFKPFEMRSRGGYSGFDIALMRQIVSGMGRTMSVADVDFAALQRGDPLDAGRCDVVASAMTITVDRDRHLDFSRPYFHSQQSLLVPTGSDVRSIDELAGSKVAVQQGTTGQTYTKQNVPADTHVVTFPSDGAMYHALKAGRVDALVQDLPVNLALEEQGGCTIVERFSTGEQYGFAVRQGDATLLNAVNMQLARLRSNGTYDRLYRSYFAPQ